MTVVGVTRDVKQDGLEQDSGPALYLPYPQDPVPWLGGVVRTVGEPSSVAGAVRRVVAEADPTLPAYGLRTMSDALAADSWLRGAYSATLAIFAVIALGLASAGVYGVVSHTENKRLREFGIRLALGAPRRDVLASVMAPGMAVVAVGLGLGLVGALWMWPVLASVLFGVSATDRSAPASLRRRRADYGRNGGRRHLGEAPGAHQPAVEATSPSGCPRRPSPPVAERSKHYSRAREGIVNLRP